MNLRLQKIPDIYAKIYEQKRYPTQADINLIERKRLKKKATHNKTSNSM